MTGKWLKTYQNSKSDLPKMAKNLWPSLSENDLPENELPENDLPKIDLLKMAKNLWPSDQKILKIFSRKNYIPLKKISTICYENFG